MRNKIEFIEGEAFARYNGEITTDDWFKNKFGTEPCELIRWDSDVVIVEFNDNTVIYTDKSIEESLGYTADRLSVGNILYGKTYEEKEETIKLPVSGRTYIKPYSQLKQDIPNYAKLVQFTEDFLKYYQLSKK